MTTSEPTTGEIVRALREVVSDPMFRIHEIAKRCRVAADRLESQERELSGISVELEQYKKWHDESIATATNNIVELEHQIADLTARAEQAEKERDAAVADLDALKDSGFCNSCVGCNAPHSESITYCTDWKRRGLPQEGERKSNG